MAFLEGALPKYDERNLANIIQCTSKAALNYDSVSCILK
jgi:hypothetical protein